MIYENDETKRSNIWKIVMSVSTVLIIIIAAFFIIKMFTANPLEGKWYSSDSDLTMDIRGDTAVYEWTADSDGEAAKMDVKYEVDKKSKVLMLYVDESAGEDEGTEVETDGLPYSLDTSYDYSIEQNVLTLTDREFGEQIIFEKQ